MNIQAYISTLLYRYQCVIVPGFGAFLSEMQSSYFDEKTNSFFPPTKKLSFNANITNNDGLLANHIARVENIAFEQATKAVKEVVSQWENTLLKEDSLTIEGIGSFHTNQENKLVFEPIENDILLKTSFGLSAVNVTPIVRTPLITAIEESETNRRRPVFNFFKYAAMLAVIAGGGAIVVNEYDSHVEKEILQMEKTVQSQVQNKIQQATFVIEPSATTITLPVKEEIEQKNDTPYYIIACAFRNGETAQQEALKLKTNGYPTAQALERTKYGMYPVTYGGYTTQAEAQKELRRIHSKLNKDAWILVQ
ncbi:MULTISPECIES: SPOR domain-containing protein [Myroides]|uniref:SPOR domain-containing protein n=1 Tax=Myroides albus TaxID=2562892 RepID=A0A6I3LPJ6_9FLAO|nr:MULTISPECIES: SPOR domain-containing protein [Myroides]MTG97895.1 SPOR domain-containing protein [Myroides albus]MVX36559.1 SPOR domain-containing protein [Myroides sp. LoEW2-1]UVD81083.1 SPOR domain-containing protein [Myroides albus]